MICPQCHHQNSPGDKFCEQCGAVLSAETDSEGATAVGAPPADAVLTRTDGSGTFSLGNRVMVGRLDTCDISINDKSVSREHARLSQLPGGYVVEDLNSTNGTMVNGDRIDEAVILRPGDTVTFGSIEFRFGDEAIPGAAAPDSGQKTAAWQYSPPEPAAQSAAPQPQEPQAASPPPWTQPAAPEPGPPAWTATPAQSPAPPAMDFPPLTPFAPPPEAPPVTPEPATEPAQQDAAGTIAQPAIAPEQPAQPESQAQPPPPQAPEPRVEAQPAASAPEAEPDAEAPVSWRQPEAASSATGGGQVVQDVLDTSARLTTLVRELAQQIDEAEAERTQRAGRVAELEKAGASLEAIRNVLGEVPPAAMSTRQIQSTQNVLDQLIQNPRDIELLMQIGRQAADIAAVVNEYSQLRRLLQRIAGSADGG